MKEKGIYKRSLRIQNTGDLFFCDEKDWEKAKTCMWYITTQGRLINKQEIFFEEYVGIQAVNRVKGCDRLDFSRSNYRV